MIRNSIVYFFALILFFTVLLPSGCLSSPASGFWLSSRDFANGGTIPLRDAYPEAGGSNISPELRWHGAPPGTKSFALTVFDPDARNGWWHWVIVNIPAKSLELPSGAGSNGRGTDLVANSFGGLGYGGPCPPPGDQPHHYIFTLYALDVVAVKAAPGADAASVSKEIQRHRIAQAVLVGRYGR